MNNKFYEIMVGFFVIMGILALTFMAFKVSGLSVNLMSNNNYRITAEFSNIGNLRVGAAVRISGVEIGSVENIELNSSYNGFVACVTLNINNKYNKIPYDYSAAIETSGILGDSFVSLKNSKIILPNSSNLEYFVNGSKIPIANTSSAINFGSLIDTFISSSKK